MKIFVSSALAAAALVAPTQAALPASVTSLMDTSVSPCDDFYQYSCGGWLKAHPLGPSDTGNDASFSVVSDNNEIVIQSILKEDWPLLGEFWDSCMDFKTQDALGAKPLQPGLQDIYRAGSKLELFKAAGKLSRTGFNLVTAFDVAGDQRNAKTNGIYIGNSDPSIKINTLLSPSAFKKIEPAFRKYITTILTLANFNPNTAAQGGQQGSAPAPVSATYFGDAVIKVETAIASLQLEIADQEGEPDAWYHKLSLSEAATKFPLTIGAYFQGAGILNTVPKGQEGIFYFFDYFEAAEKLLASIDIKDLKTYVAYLYINNRTRYLGNAFYNAYFDFFGKVINGQAARSSDASICTYRVQQYFPDLIGKYYFMKVFDQVKQDNADSMIAAIKEAMGQHIKNLSWLDNATRLEAAGKLAKVVDLIGQSKVKQSYPFVVGRETYFDNVNTIAVDTWTKTVKKIGYTVDRNLWAMSAAEVNAYYSPLENKMVFPAAILQPPFFDASAHSAKNFGAIGAIMGHELTHGFDSSGRNYDGDGTQRNWWTDSTAAEFESRANCMKKQYSGFVVNGANGKPLINIEGNRTITENIADNGGFSLTWDAFHAYQASSKYESKGLTPAEADQLIFLSFAQTWCGNQNDASIVSQVTGDPHSIGQWRANGVAMNSDHFGPTFNCKAGTPMNPVKKCQIW